MLKCSILSSTALLGETGDILGWRYNPLNGSCFAGISSSPPDPGEDPEYLTGPSSGMNFALAKFVSKYLELLNRQIC